MLESAMPLRVSEAKSAANREKESQLTAAAGGRAHQLTLRPGLRVVRRHPHGEVGALVLVRRVREPRRLVASEYRALAHGADERRVRADRAPCLSLAAGSDAFVRASETASRAADQMRGAYSVLVLTARQRHVGRVWLVLMLALHRGNAEAARRTQMEDGGPWAHMTWPFGRRASCVSSSPTPSVPLKMCAVRQLLPLSSARNGR